MDSCRFDLPDWVPQNGITSGSQRHDASDDLHLAALLGKTLLERNRDLETKLKKLEEFAEETLNGNKALSRQVRDYQDALSTANRSCEQLEQKLEDSESDNRDLKLKFTKQEVTLAVKEKVIEDLQLALESLESENMELRDTAKLQLRNQKHSPHEINSATPTSPQQMERSHSYAGFDRLDNSSELDDLVIDLQKKLSDSQYQRSKFKQSADTLLSENKKLNELLMKTETEVIDLQARVKLLEDQASERSEPVTPIPPQSPGRKPFLISSFSNPGNLCPHCSVNLADTSFDSTIPLSVMGTKDCDFSGNESNTTLFTELQNEFGVLQNKFEKLLQECSCSASVPYKDLAKDAVTTGRESSNNEPKTKNPSTTSTDSKFQDTSLKDLFEEVYATLKQTTFVADKLLEKRKSFQT